MPEALAVLFEAAGAVMALGGSLVFAGYWATRVLTPPALRPYAVLMMPIVGAALLVVASYFLNLVTNMTVATALMLASSAAINVWVVRAYGWRMPRPSRSQLVVVGVALALLAVAFVPHAQARSLGLLGLNIDEDLYVPLAELLKTDTARLDNAGIGPFHDEFQSVRNHARGWGFPYLLTVTSVLANASAFHAYVPTLYLLLALSVPAVFVFGRIALGVSERTAALGAVIYAMHGLPLWFAGMGFGPHVVSFLLFPSAVATGVVAVRDGGRRAVVLAALTSGALLVSYFWAITAVYAAVASLVSVALVLSGPGRMVRLRRTIAVVVGVGVAAAPGLYWFVRWAAPIATDIASNLDGEFGNAWGDTVFARIELAFGMAPYRLVGNVGPFPPELTDAVQVAKDALFWPVLALALMGLLTLRGNRRVGWAMAIAYAGFMAWVAVGAQYQYGHLKNLSYVAYFVAVLIAMGISNVLHGDFALWSVSAGSRLSRWLDPVRPGLRVSGVTVAIILGVALLHSTFQSLSWYWPGVGWQTERRVAHDARAAASLIPENSRVLFAHDLRIPLSGDRVTLSDHTLGFHFPQHQRESLANRARSIWAGALTHSDVFGVVPTLAFTSVEFDVANDYSFIVMNSDSDARTYGLLPTDTVYSTPYWTVFAVPPDDILTASEISEQSAYRLDVPSGSKLRLGLREGALAVGRGIEPLTGSVMIGLMAWRPSTVHLGGTAEDVRQVDVVPGLTWITITSAGDGPVEMWLDEPSGQVQVVAARLLPETFDRGHRIEWVPRVAVSVDAQWVDGVVHGSIILANPKGRGANIGVTFQETPTQGFWPTDVEVKRLASRIDFTYDPTARVLEQRIEGHVPSFREARLTDVDEYRLLKLEFERGFVDMYSVPITRYSMGVEGPYHVAVLSQIHVFDLIRAN